MESHEGSGNAKERSVKAVQEFSTAVADAAKEAGPLLQALVEATKEMVVSSAPIVSNLVTNIERTATPPRSESVEQKPTDWVRISSDIARDVSNSLGEWAKVIQRSAESFSKDLQREGEIRKNPA
jgi:hypothetical protein